MTTKVENRIAYWNQSKWLVLSSGYFLIPAMYAFYYEEYFYSNLLSIVSIVSMNYWRDATDSYRRTLDIVSARTSFLLFFYNGVKYTTNPQIKKVGYLNLCLILYFFYRSHKLYSMNSMDWVTSHMLFHLFIAVNQLLVLDSMFFDDYCEYSCDQSIDYGADLYEEDL